MVTWIAAADAAAALTGARRVQPDRWIVKENSYAVTASGELEGEACAARPVRFRVVDASGREVFVPDEPWMAKAMLEAFTQALWLATRKEALDDRGVLAWEPATVREPCPGCAEELRFPVQVPHLRDDVRLSEVRDAVVTSIPGLVCERCGTGAILEARPLAGLCWPCAARAEAQGGAGHGVRRVTEARVRVPEDEEDGPVAFEGPLEQAVRWLERERPLSFLLEDAVSGRRLDVTLRDTPEAASGEDARELRSRRRAFARHRTERRQRLLALGVDPDAVMAEVLTEAAAERGDEPFDGFSPQWELDERAEERLDRLAVRRAMERLAAGTPPPGLLAPEAGETPERTAARVAALPVRVFVARSWPRRNRFARRPGLELFDPWGQAIDDDVEGLLVGHLNIALGDPSEPATWEGIAALRVTGEGFILHEDIPIARLAT